MTPDAVTTEGEPFDWPAFVGAYFARYSTRKFDFMRAAFAPHVDQYILLKDATPNDIVKATESFFATRESIEYKLDPGSLKVSSDTEGTRIECAVDMSWANRKGDADAPFASPVTYAVRVTVALTFDSARRIVRYVETNVRKDYLRVALRAPFNCGSGELYQFSVEGTPLPFGTIVEDMHESRLVEGGEVSFTQRRVRYRGKSDWVTDHEWSRKYPCDQHYFVPTASVAGR